MTLTQAFAIIGGAATLQQLRDFRFVPNDLIDGRLIEPVDKEGRYWTLTNAGRTGNPASRDVDAEIRTRDASGQV